jgi:hypothetical protein
MHRNLTGVESRLSITYGLTPDIAVNLAVPYVAYRSLGSTTKAWTITRSTTGFGDVALLARYTFVKSVQRCQVSNAEGVRFGVEPVAKVRVDLPFELQPRDEPAQ